MLLLCKYLNESEEKRNIVPKEIDSRMEWSPDTRFAIDSDDT